MLNDETKSKMADKLSSCDAMTVLLVDLLTRPPVYAVYNQGTPRMAEELAEALGQAGNPGRLGADRSYEDAKEEAQRELADSLHAILDAQLGVEGDKERVGIRARVLEVAKRAKPVWPPRLWLPMQREKVRVAKETPVWGPGFRPEVGRVLEVLGYGGWAAPFEETDGLEFARAGKVTLQVLDAVTNTVQLVLLECCEPAREEAE